MPGHLEADAGEPERRLEIAQPALRLLHVRLEQVERVAEPIAPGAHLVELVGEELLDLRLREPVQLLALELAVEIAIAGRASAGRGARCARCGPRRRAGRTPRGRARRSRPRAGGPRARRGAARSRPSRTRPAPARRAGRAGPGRRTARARAGRTRRARRARPGEAGCAPRRRRAGALPERRDDPVHRRALQAHHGVAAPARAVHVLDEPRAARRSPPSGRR